MTIPDPVAPPRCYAHPDRAAGSVCRRCGRPICPDCMREAPVGWQCSSCVREAQRTSPVVRWRPSSGVGRLGGTRVTPVVITLIVINVVAWLYEKQHLTASFEFKYFLVPGLVHSHWYSLITSAFLHDPSNPWHILLNMVSLAIVGPPVEAAMGRVRFAVLYLLSAAGGSVGYYLLAHPFVPGVGASGAIFGVMGAYFVLAKMRGGDTQSILGLLLVNVVYSFTGGIAWQDHLGGLITGSLVAFGLMWTPGRLRRPSEVAQFVQGMAVVLAGTLVLGLLVQIPPGHVNL